MWHSPITLENFPFSHTHTHNWLNSDLQTSLKSVRELVFILQKHLLCHSSFLEELILWGFTLSPFFFFFANLSFLFIFIYCYPSFFLRTGMEIIFKFSFLWTHLKLSHLDHGDACIYAHIAYYIVPLWFWLIVWGEFLMRVLDWNVKTINQWQIAWTKLWKLLELTFAGTLVGELVELPWAELMWI